MRKPAGDPAASRAIAGRRRRRGRVHRTVAAITALVFALLGFGPAPVASAGTLNLAITPIDASDGSTITSIANGQHGNRITYEVQFSCQATACDDAEVEFAPSAPDPHGLLPAGRYLLMYDSWVPPVTGGTISGTDETGKTASLGDLSAGQSGNFRVTYEVPGDAYRAVPYSAFYPDGFKIEMAATISSSNSTSVTADASPVTWHIGLPPANQPSAAITAPASSKPDTNVSYRLTMNPGNIYIGGSNSGVRGYASRAAVGHYQVVYHLPEQAEFVSAFDGGVYDPAAHTITWQRGTAAKPVYAARGGWGPNAVSGYNGGGVAADNPAGSALGDDNYAYFNPREVVLKFPGKNFDDADANGCNFSADVQSSLDVTVGYLDADRTTRSVSANRTVQVACWDPFVGIEAQKWSNATWVNPIYMVNIPAPGNPDQISYYWMVRVHNRGNQPAVAVIDEPNLSQEDLEVMQVWPSGVGATFEWTRSDGESGTTTRNHNQVLTAPGNTYFTSVKATTTEIAPGRVQPTDTTETLGHVLYRFRVKDDAPLGEQRTNTADVSVSYPGLTGPVKDTTGKEVSLPIEQTASRTIQFSRPSPVLAAAFMGAPVVGGPQLIPGTPVTFTARGATNLVWPGTTIRPQYAFIAPVGWTVVPSSASVAAGAPAGVTYDYRTAVIGGVTRSVVVATWPSTITPSTTGEEFWPVLTVQATPTATAPTGVNAATALIWTGDASGVLSDSVGNQVFATATNQFRASPGTAVDSGDVDNDSNRTEEFAQAGSAAMTVAATSGLRMIKELCIPDTSAPDGCAWTADTSSPHLVPVNVDDITYRLTITNGGSSALTNVVAYDVLPHKGDKSLTPDATPRDSDFGLTIKSVGSVGAGITMAYSASTNPTRPEVYPSAPDTVDDWGTDAAGKKAARIRISSLPGGQSRSVVIVAATDGTGAADDKVCNSAAIDSSQTLPTEPTAVCVALAEADLAVELTTFEKLQAGRPTMLGYTVTNRGGSDRAPAAVEIEVPDGMTVSDLEVDGWNCTVDGGGSAPVSGPATLNCVPVDDDDQPRLLERDQAEVLSFPVVVEEDSGELCTGAKVTGTFFDPVAANNAATGCQQIAPPPAGLAITKTDGQTTTQIGAEYTYTIKVDNTLLSETVTDLTVTDTLPDSLELVSADGDPDVSGQQLTWSLDTLAPLATAERHVTVKVRGNADSPVVNEAVVTADDPGFPDQKLTDSDEDSNAVLKLSVAKTSDARESGVRDGDVITYTVTVTGDDAGDYTGARITDDLTDVLDDATFVAGSASLSVDGGAAQPVGDPTAGLLTWTGTIPTGVDAVLTYQVRVGEPDNGRLRNTVSTAPTPTDCDTATGLDENGMACAVLSTSFAPTITKTVESLTQDDDGSWTIEYGIDVTNPAPTEAEYDLSDDLAFGPGMTVTSATVDPPGGITPETWSGSGDVVVGADLPGGDTHHYTVTVVADAGTTAGTAAAVCTEGEALGFANTAALTLDGGTREEAEACAEPAKPTVTKGLDGPPVQRDDGRWAVTYLITVANAAERPDGGLTYRLEDTLDFPDGLTVDEVEVTPPTGVTANDEFTGGLTEIDGNTVTADSELIDGVARIPAASGGSPAVQEYRVQLIVSGAGAVDSTLLACGASGAGYGNWVSLLVGAVELGRATACADIRLPELEITKTADSKSGTRPGDRIAYTIVAKNVGDADFTVGDPAELVDDMSDLIDDARYLDDATADVGNMVWASPHLTWTGPLGAGETAKITYTVQVREAGAGDGHIVNQVRLADIAKPVDDVPACDDPSGGDGGVPACEVSLRVDNRSVPLPIPVPPNPPVPLPDSVSDSLADTGAAVPLGVLIAALVAIGAGLLLTRRGRKVD